ncbi:subtilisin-like protease Glyma18g48580 [Phoenix dactylifera]|uniref:Subtilisin-like protease Glyma18g48580 n=1 Tax=Phoenix dactylifera TaxID=42345 RepID=A0A8B7BS43_PHODC|nr:subtilisin-like protease Glyma18g48580 [Phoenix dactylifera]
MEGARFTIFFLFSISLFSVLKAKDEAAMTADIYIVVVEKPESIQLEVSYLKTLSAALGSNEAAKKALIYSYKTVTYGFAAWLTQKQAFEISKQPGVLLVMIDKKYNLFPAPVGPQHAPVGPRHAGLA